MVVNSKSAKDGQLEMLRWNYRNAFGEWVLQVNRMEEVRAATADDGTVKAAEERVDVAEVAYRVSRNRLAEEMDAKPHCGC
jgi:hypothetical protein